MRGRIFFSLNPPPLVVLVALVMFLFPPSLTAFTTPRAFHPNQQCGGPSTVEQNRRLTSCDSSARLYQHKYLSFWRLRDSLQEEAESFSKVSGRTNDPIAFGAGFSTKPDLLEALQEAVGLALAALPADTASIDLAMVHVSSLYDGGAHAPATTVVPTILALLGDRQVHVQHLIGSSVAGCISSSSSLPGTTQSKSASGASISCRPVEWEGVPAVSVTLAVLPEVHVESFAVSSSDVPDDWPYLSPAEWKRAVGLSTLSSISNDAGHKRSDEAVVWLLPSPAFAVDLDALVQGFANFYPSSQIVGGVASTVSSLSRAKLYQWSRNKGGSPLSYSDGCVGVVLQGDVQVRQMTAQGAKPVGGIYQILKAQDSTISVIVLDEAATEALQMEEESNLSEDEREDDADATIDERQRRAQFYAKASIPKPVLAEANFLMRTLSDDDQVFMRRQLLVGLEQGGSVGRTASELQRLASGEGHRFAVHLVASAGMKDGSVTLPLGSVKVQPGTRMRFFVRESEFAKKEVEALWMGYKKRALTEQFDVSRDTPASEATSSTFTPAACLVVPTLDRGSKFFMGKQGYESGAVARMVPGIPCVAGFFSNGVVGRMDVAETAKTGVQGSASGYFLLGSKSNRPVYSPASAAAEAAVRKEQLEAEQLAAQELVAEDEKRQQRASKGADLTRQRAPRSDDGELILKRREVHSGRALTVSTVEWSVAEKLAKPSSTLEGYMWEKETEVDRFRERVPLANLVSQCRLSAEDPTIPKPRDWVGPFQRAAAEGFVIVPECKRLEPTTGSLRGRYDVSKLVREFTLAGVPVLSVNCDNVLFGGSLDDITEARQAATSASMEDTRSDDGVVVPAILASDLLLYPYQLYKLRLAGADAVNLVAGALASKDLKYLTKIASSLQLQTLITVTSEVQLQGLLNLPDGSFDGLILSNRELEDYSFDLTGRQVLRLLSSDELQKLRQRRGSAFPVLVEGRVGLIERPGPNRNPSALQYVRELQDAGAGGAIVGGGLAGKLSDSAMEAIQALQVMV